MFVQPAADIPAFCHIVIQVRGGEASYEPSKMAEAICNGEIHFSKPTKEIKPLWVSFLPPNTQEAAYQKRAHGGDSWGQDVPLHVWLYFMAVEADDPHVGRRERR